MRYLVVTLGSAGDLHPFVAVARALAAAGHEVEVMSNGPYEEAVRREGLAFSALCSARDHGRTAEHPDLWHPMRGFGVLWRHLAVPAIEPVRARVSACLREDPSLRVLASPLAVGARIARAQQPFGLCSLYTAPANLRSTRDPMYLGAWRVPSWVPQFARRQLWRLLDWRKLEPMARPAVDGACRAAGLPAPVGSLFGDWIHSPDGGVTLFPETFCGLQRDWPQNLHSGDFPIFRSRGDDHLAAPIQRFLETGPAPAVIFPGSAAGAHGKGLLHDALVACRALGLRAIALGAAAMDIANEPPEDPEFVLRHGHAALDLLLPRASVFVHHGGIGSCAQGLRAQVPQLIRPFAYDQFDNAARIEADGGGRFIPPGAGSRAAFLQALEELAFGSSAIRRHAAQGDVDGLCAVLRAVSAWEATRLA
jgi:rhamnosyltransferase subunit B